MAGLTGFQKRRILELVLLAGSLCLTAALFIAVFNYFPVENTSLGLDWHVIWTGLNHGQIVMGGMDAHVGGLFTPPWGILLLWPLGFLPFRVSWGLISFVTIVILALCVPRKDQQKLNVTAIVLLLLSFPALRNLADGNLEGLVVGGIVLMLWAYRRISPLTFSLGLLLATMKLQETWLLSIVLLYLIYKNWPTARRWQMALAAGTAIGLSLWLWGSAWISAVLIDQDNHVGKGSLIDISLSAALGRLGIPAVLIMAAWLTLFGMTLLLVWRHHHGEMSWLYATFLVAASMLLAPYTSGNSFLTIVAIGIIPIFLSRPRLGILLLVLSDLPFLMTHDMLYYYQSYYWTAMLLLVWAITGYLAWKQTDLAKAIVGATLDRS